MGISNPILQFLHTPHGRKGAQLLKANDLFNEVYVEVSPHNTPHPKKKDVAVKIQERSKLRELRKFPLTLFLAAGYKLDFFFK